MLIWNKRKTRIKKDEQYITLNELELEVIKDQYKDTLKSLQENEIVLSTFINSLTEPALLIDKDFNIIICNNVLSKRLGKKNEELIGKYAFGFLSPEIARVREESVKKVFTTGKSVTFEDSRNGYYYINSIYPINDFKGRITKAAIFALDITDKKLSDEKLKESEEKYRTLVERIPEGIYRCNNNGKFLEVNQAMVEILGYESKEDLLKINIKDDLYADKADIQNQLITDDSEKHDPCANRARLRTLKLFKKDGTIIYTEDHEHCVYDKDGNFLYYEGILRDVTDKVYAEDKLRESEEKFRTFMESSSELMFIADENKNFTYMNRAMLKTVGYTKEDVEQIKLDQIYDDESRNYIFSNEKQNELIEEGHLNEEINLKTKDKKRIFGEIKINAIFNPKGDFVGSRAIFHDLTERKKYENNLLESEEKYRSLFENLPVGIGIVSSEGKVISANDQAFKIFGYNYEDLDWLKTFHFYTNAEQREIILKKILEEKLVRNFEIPVIKKDGSQIYVFANVKPIKYSGEDCLLIVFDDITERKLNEEKILKLSKAVEQSPASIIITDTNGKIEYVNKKFSEITGFSLKEIIGKNPRILKSGIHSNEFYKKLWETINSGQEWKGELLNKKKNGDVYWESASLSPIRNGHNEIKYFLAVKEDITDRKKIEEELRLAKEEAEKADKLKSEFLAQMSHEIRTPINVILNFNSLIKDEIESKVNLETRSYFDRIELASRRIIRTIDLILEMSALHTGTYEVIRKKIDLNNDILENLFLEYKPLADEKNIKFKLTLNTKETTILADEFSANQIFSNLIDNAIKYTDDGTIEITVDRVDFNKVVVKISDTGIGISKEYLPNLFTLFSQEEQGYSRRYDGTGLGLALVKKYCDLNGALLSVKSEKGKGTEFKITFFTRQN